MTGNSDWNDRRGREGGREKKFIYQCVCTVLIKSEHNSSDVIRCAKALESSVYSI